MPLHGASPQEKPIHHEKDRLVLLDEVMDKKEHLSKKKWLTLSTCSLFWWILSCVQNEIKIIHDITWFYLEVVLWTCPWVRPNLKQYFNIFPLKQIDIFLAMEHSKSDHQFMLSQNRQNNSQTFSQLRCKRKKRCMNACFSDFQLRIKSKRCKQFTFHTLHIFDIVQVDNPIRAISYWKFCHWFCAKNVVMVHPNPPHINRSNKRSIMH